MPTCAPNLMVMGAGFFFSANPIVLSDPNVLLNPRVTFCFLALASSMATPSMSSSLESLSYFLFSPSEGLRFRETSDERLKPNQGEIHWQIWIFVPINIPGWKTWICSLFTFSLRKSSCRWNPFWGKSFHVKSTNLIDTTVRAHLCGMLRKRDKFQYFIAIFQYLSLIMKANRNTLNIRSISFGKKKFFKQFFAKLTYKSCFQLDERFS